MDYNLLLEVIRYAVQVMLLLLSVASIIYAKVKGKSSKKIEQMEDFFNYVLEQVTVAEDLKGYKGEDKEAFVLSSVNNYAKLKKLKLPEATQRKIIQNIVFTTKNVNTGEGVKK